MNPSQFTETISFHTGLLDAVTRAKAAYPTAHAALDGGLELCLADGVELLITDLAIVDSHPHAEEVYHVQWYCECGEVPTVFEGRYASSNCEHWWAKYLYKRALETLFLASGRTRWENAMYTAREDWLSFGTVAWHADRRQWRFTPREGEDIPPPDIDRDGGLWLDFQDFVMRGWGEDEDDVIWGPPLAADTQN